MNNKKLKFYRLKPILSIIILSIGLPLIIIGHSDLFSNLSENTRDWFAIVGQLMLIYPLLETVIFKNTIFYGKKRVTITLNNWKGHHIMLRDVTEVEFFNHTLFIHLNNQSTKKFDLEGYSKEDIQRLLEILELKRVYLAP